MNPMFELDHEVAAVVGGAGVLGRAIARALGCAGAAVAVLGRRESALWDTANGLRVEGIDAHPIKMDATDSDSIQTAVERIQAQLGTATILVNAAGTNNGTPFAELDRNEWNRVIDVNLTAPFLTSRVFAEQMRRNGTGGSIINLSSASSGPPLSNVLAYSVSKAGLNVLTQYLATELAPFDIRVNAIAPGFVPAEQNRELLTRKRVEAIIRHTPMARLGEAGEVAGAAVWLASRKASGFVTGAIIRVDGGFTSMTI